MFFVLILPSPTAISTLSLHDALPISARRRPGRVEGQPVYPRRADDRRVADPRLVHSTVRCHCSSIVRWKDRKSTRLNSSHRCISYAVFCLKKKRTTRALEEPAGALSG